MLQSFLLHSIAEQWKPISIKIYSVIMVSKYVLSIGNFLAIYSLHGSSNDEYNYMERQILMFGWKSPEWGLESHLLVLVIIISKSTIRTTNRLSKIQLNDYPTAMLYNPETDGGGRVLIGPFCFMARQRIRWNYQAKRWDNLPAVMSNPTVVFLDLARGYRSHAVIRHYQSYLIAWMDSRMSGYLWWV